MQNTVEWICPHCSSKLQQQPKTWVCANGHSFDVAKQGYVNLHSVQEKNSKQPGDSKAMIQARRRFLSTGHFDELLQALIQLIQQLQPATTKEAVDVKKTWLDIGCGEGYYTGHLQGSLPNTQWQGIDIAKDAIKLAASAHPAQFAVASSRRIPVAENSCDGVLQIFAPSFPAEISRVLKPGGTWIRVTPGPNHLQELRQAIYPTARPHTAAEMPEGFQASSNQPNAVKVTSTITLTNTASTENTTAIQDLVAMTPYQWRGSQTEKAALSELSHLSVTLDFTIEQLQQA